MSDLAPPSPTTDRARSSRRRVSIVFAAMAVVVAACGSDAPANEAEQPSLDLDQLDAELDAIEFESEPIDGVAVLGNASLADDAPSSAGHGTEQAGEQPGEQASEEFDDEFIEPCPDEGACTELDEGPPPVEPPAFVPTAEWAPFCTVLAAIDERPMPSDPLEQLTVVDRWFALLDPHLPDEIVADFGVLDALLDEAVAAGTADILEGPDEGVEEASDRIGDAIDTNCSGR